MTENPVELVSGKFTLYQTPKGGMHLTMIVEGEVEPRHIEIPAMMVKLMQKRFGSADAFSPMELSVPDVTIDALSDIGYNSGE